MASLDSVFICPHCSESFTLVNRSLRCAQGHSFDIARQGYASLMTGSGIRSDTREMVQARDWFLSRGIYEPIARSLVSIASLIGLEDRHYPLMADLGGGTGWYSRFMLDSFPTLGGVLVDASAFAARIAAKAHPRLLVGTTDLWKSIPLYDSSVTLALVIFAPRNPVEISRILSSDGVCLVVVPGENHLAEIRAAVPMVGIEPDKQTRLLEQFDGFRHEGTTDLDYEVVLTPEEIAAVITMGPSAYHSSGDLLRVKDPQKVTISVRIHRFHPSLCHGDV